MQQILNVLLAYRVEFKQVPSYRSLMNDTFHMCFHTCSVCRHGFQHAVFLPHSFQVNVQICPPCKSLVRLRHSAHSWQMPSFLYPIMPFRIWFPVFTLLDILSEICCQCTFSPKSCSGLQRSSCLEKFHGTQAECILNYIDFFSLHRYQVL